MWVCVLLDELLPCVWSVGCVVVRLYCLPAGLMTVCLAICLANSSHGLVVGRLYLQTCSWLSGCTARPQEGCPIRWFTSLLAGWVPERLACGLLFGRLYV